MWPFMKGLHPQLVASSICLLAASGCVERILQIRSDPPGAVAYVNGEKVGTTPCDHPFTFYGTVDVTLRGPPEPKRWGYLSHREMVTLSPPWYEVFPLDFFSELLLPWTLHDDHALEVRLASSPLEVDEGEGEDLKQEAEKLRQELGPPPRDAWPGS
jgi:hypothetical protein